MNAYCIGMVKNALDQCVVNLIKDGYHCTLCIYVDDLLITLSRRHRFVINYLQDTFKAITIQHGNTHSYLGMDIVFTGIKQNYL
jgi:hypothetical protein